MSFRSVLPVFVTLVLAFNFACKSSKRSSIVDTEPQKLLMTLLQLDKQHEKQQALTYTLACKGVNAVDGVLNDISESSQVSFMVTGVKIGDTCEVKVFDKSMSSENIEFTKEDKMIYYAPQVYVSSNPAGGLTGSAVLQKTWQIKLVDATVVVNVTFENAIPPDVEKFNAQLTCEPSSLVAKEKIKQFDDAKNTGLYIFPVKIDNSKREYHCKNLTLYLDTIPKYKAVIDEKFSPSSGDAINLRTLARLNEMTYEEATGLDVTVQIITGCPGEQILDLDTGKCVNKK